MQFTYKDYSELLSLISHNGYRNRTYTDWNTDECCCILRHDIDYDLRCALPIAEIECTHNVKSTYFILLSSDFYNLLSEDSKIIIRELLKAGHNIGLHFDEMNYPEIIGNVEKIKNAILTEVDIMQQVLGLSINSVSMHRPSKNILDADLNIPGIINSYSKVFFKDFKYLSDSRRRWREPVEDIVQNEEYKRLHILTHPFWYKEEEVALSDTLVDFIRKGKSDRYNILDNNFTNLQEALEGNKTSCI